jgi:hypothetical protein
VPLPTATRALLALHRVDLVPTSARRVPARRRYPHAEHTTVEQRPCLCWARSRVSTDLCRVHFPACRHPVYVPCRAHVVGVVPSPQLCHRPFTRTHQHRVEALSFLLNLCTRTHAHVRLFTGVCPQPTPPGRSSPFSLSLFPCPVHAINFVSLPWPCRRRSAHTRTHATEGPSPCCTYL